MKNIELAADALFAGYDGKTIVSDVSITIPQNKISVILGANGCGKSTLLKTFAKLFEYSRAAEPPVQCGVSHLSRRTEPHCL